MTHLYNPCSVLSFTGYPNYDSLDKNKKNKEKEYAHSISLEPCSLS